MYISLNQLFTFIAFLLLIILLVLAIIVLFKLNKVVSSVFELTCNELPSISKNIVEITDNVKDISDVATEFTADAIVTKENLINNYEILKEVLKIVKSVFLK